MPESNIGFYGHVKQYHNLKAEIDQAILDVLESGSYVLGPQLVKFEEELARYMKTKETVGVNSGTDALLLVFLALGLGPGDEVITTSNTFFATAEAIWLAGATPVFVDSDPGPAISMSARSKRRSRQKLAPSCPCICTA